MKIGILGYGNLGRGVECAIKQNPDMELAAVFTRRTPETVSILTEGAAVCSVNDVEQWKDKIDVMILCGGSATDLPVQSVETIRDVQCYRQLRYTCKNSGAFCKCRCCRKEEWSCRHHLSRLGSGYVLFKPYVCKCDLTGRP